MPSHAVLSTQWPTALSSTPAGCAADGERALIVAYSVVADATDNRCLRPMVEAARDSLQVGSPLWTSWPVGYSNGEHTAALAARGVLAHIPANRAVDSQDEGSDEMATGALIWNLKRAIRVLGTGQLSSGWLRRSRSPAKTTTPLTGRC